MHDIILVGDDNVTFLS